MKVSKVNHHGKTRYRVNDPQGEGGRRQRKFFETREDADNYVKERTKDTKAYGIHFATIPTEQRAAITEETVAAAFEGGPQTITRKEAVKALQSHCGCCLTAAYVALSPNGRFAAHLREDNGMLSWIPFPFVERRHYFVELSTANSCPQNRPVYPCVYGVLHRCWTP